MADIDPLTGLIEQLETAATRPASATTRDQSATIEVGPDGSLYAIRLTEAGRRMDPDQLAATIVRLHREALVAVRSDIAAAITAIERDPRLRAQRERATEALRQPISRSGDWG